MKYSDFEQHMASKLGKAKEPVQMDSLLAALDLNGKSDRKPNGIFIILPFLLLAGGLFYFGSTSLMNESGEKSKGLYSENQTKSSQPIGQSNSELEDTKNVRSIASDKNILSSPAEDAAGNDANAIRSKHSLESNGSQNNNLRANSKNSAEIASSRLTSNNAKKGDSDSSNAEVNVNTKVNHSILRNHSTSVNNQSVLSSKKTDGSLSYNSLLPKGKGKVKMAVNAPKLNKGLKITHLSRSERGQNENYTSKLSKAEKKSLERILNVEPLSKRRRVFDVTDLSDDNDELFKRMKINCPSFDQAYWSFAIVPEVGIFAPIKTLKLKGIDSTPSFEKRKADEKSLEGINIGLYGMLVRDKLPIFLKAGLSYTKISERMELEYNFTEAKETFGVISQTVSENGEVITTVEGPIIVETTFTGRNRRHHYIHLLDLPVSAGYSTYIGGFDIAIEGGVKVNLITRATGNQLISQRGYDNLSFSQSFKRRIGLSYFGGLMVGRNFGRFGDFYLAPRFHYYSEDFTSATNPVSQKYVSVGVNAGVIYKIK